jgi:hypothetical protein
MDDSVDALLDAVYLLVERFVQRQQLPLEVIREFRPYWVDSTKHRPSKKYASATGTGYWGENNEWRYYLHGVGCRLIHTITGEPVDWDASDPYRFDPYWFVEWLSWFLRQNVFFRQPDEDNAILTYQP